MSSIPVSEVTKHEGEQEGFSSAEVADDTHNRNLHSLGDFVHNFFKTFLIKVKLEKHFFPIFFFFKLDDLERFLR